jgi:hypothetical protein
MALTDEEFKRVVEEFKETGHESPIPRPVSCSGIFFFDDCGRNFADSIERFEGRLDAGASSFAVIWADLSGHSHAAPKKHQSGPVGSIDTKGRIGGEARISSCGSKCKWQKTNKRAKTNGSLHGMRDDRLGDMDIMALREALSLPVLAHPTQ